MGMLQDSLKSMSNLFSASPEDSNFAKKKCQCAKKWFAQYHMEGKINEISMSGKLLLRANTNPNFKAIIDYLNGKNTKYMDLTNTFYEDIKQSVNIGSNKEIMIFGLPNSGKSTEGQDIAKSIEYYINKIENIDYSARKTNNTETDGFLTNHIYVCFDTSKISKNASNFVKRDIIIADEVPDIEGTGSHISKEQVDNISKLVRKKQLYFIYISPEKIMFKVINYYIETLGKDYVNKKIRCIIYGEDGEPQGIIILPLHTDQEFNDKYDLMKDTNIDNLLKNGGAVSIGIDLEKLEAESNKALEMAIGLKDLTLKGADFKNVIIPKLQIVGSQAYTESVAREAFIKFKKYLDGLPKPEKEVKEKKKSSAEKVKQASINKISEKVNDFGEFVYNSIYQADADLDTIRLAEICRKFLQGCTQKQVYEYLKEKEKEIEGIECSEGTINNIWSEARVSKVGYLLQGWIGLMLGGDGSNINNDRDPDFIDQFENIFSIKFTGRKGEKKARSHTFYQTKSCDVGLVPEHNLAIEKHQPYFLVCLALEWKYNNRLKIIPIDPFSDEGTVIVNDDTPTLDFAYFDHLITLAEIQKNDHKIKDDKFDNDKNNDHKIKDDKFDNDKNNDNDSGISPLSNNLFLNSDMVIDNMVNQCA